MNLNFKQAFRLNKKEVSINYLNENYDFTITPLTGSAREQVIKIAQAEDGQSETEAARIYLSNAVVLPELTAEQIAEMIEYAYPLAFNLVREINTATQEFDKKVEQLRTEAEKN